MAIAHRGRRNLLSGLFAATLIVTVEPAFTVTRATDGIDAIITGSVNPSVRPDDA